MKLYEQTAHELRLRLAAREISAVELTQSILDRIEAIDGDVRAFLVVDRSGALAAAAEADRALQLGQGVGPWTGIPIAVKDIIATQGLSTSCGSRMLEGFAPSYDASVIARLRAQHAVIIGKTNMDEFGMGSSTENSAYQVTRNPWNLNHVPGGSSGGSAAAIAAEEAIVALGSDTGGSIRQPASFCGVVGFKPTYGRVSRYGLIAYASSLDTIGPMTKDVEDAACLLMSVGGHDILDATTANRPMPNLVEQLDRGVDGLRIGVPGEYFSEGVTAEVRECIIQATGMLADAGAEIVDITVPLTRYAIPTYYLIAMSEASANLARYDGVKYGLRVDRSNLETTTEATRQAGFGTEVKRRIILGTYALSAGYHDKFYVKAQRVRTLLIEDYARAFARCDVLICPASPFPAFRLGEKTEDPLAMYLADIHTITANLIGNPGLCIPGSFSSEGLPIGIQLLARPFEEATLVRVGFALELRLRTYLSNHRPALAARADDN